MNRRSWILGGTLAAGAVATSVLYGQIRSRVSDVSKRSLSSRSGPFAVLPGFHVVVLTRSGERQTDGTRSPDLPDGMACFLGQDGTWILLRNHELMGDASSGAYPEGQPEEAYRKNVHGGVSRVVVDPKTLRVLSTNMVLTGTLRNCAGGPSPWGWVSCEETTEDNHGYSFLCSPSAERVQKARVLPGYGRFRHEAAAIDLDSYCAYLTEDDPVGCLYRFTPHDKSAPFEGKLEALRIVGRPGLHTEASLTLGAAVKIDWVKVDDADARKRALHEQALDRGAAQFSRAEGAWLDGDGVVFTATTGGKLGQGQLFRIDFKRQTLSLVAEARSDSDFKGPDNVTLSPWGDFIVAENGPSPSHVYVVRADGKMLPLLRNDHSDSELAGVCFSPDGKVLFCNLQNDGLTVAIRGPWDSGPKLFAG